MRFRPLHNRVVVVNERETMKKSKVRNLISLAACCMLASCGKTPTYTVTWVIDGVEHTETYEKGATPSYKGETPTKTSDKTYDYTFTGWDKDFEPITGDITYTAEFSSTLIDYTITWAVDQNTTTEVYHYGDTPSFKGSTDKAADSTYSYTFKGWDKEIVPVDSDTTYTAVYDSSYVDYTITWVVDGNSTTETYHYGDTPSFKGSTDKASTAEYTYTFTGWDKDLVPVNSNATYTALYEQAKNKYTITWVIGDKTVTNEVEYGTIPTAPTDTAKQGNEEYSYTFLGWDKDITAVTGNETYTARYQETKNQYEVTFVSDGTELGKKKVTYGETLTASDITAPEKENITFYGWKIEGKEYTPTALPIITHAVTAEAVYKAAIEVKSVNTITSEELTTKTTYCEVGEEYKIEADAKDGLVADKDYVKGIADKNASITINYSPLSVWDGESEEMETVDESNYRISNSKQFAYFAAQVNAGVTYEGKTITLVSSLQINKSFPQIGKAEASFKGTFDGNNCSIRGIEISSTATRTALFYGMTSGTIKNLSLYGSASVAQYGSVLVGRAVTSTIDNVTNYATMNQTTKNGAGAIAGAILTGSKIQNCVNYGDVTGATSNNKTAGIVGMIESGEGSVHNCKNFGTVKGATLVGGIVGEVAAITSANAGIFDCENYGSVSSIATSSNAVTGGIVGQFTDPKSTAKTKLNGCTNYGDVTGSTALDSPVGGIVGAYNAKTDISNVANYGNILGNSRTGGIVGNLYGALSNGKNYGTVQVEGTGTNKGCYAGGIAAVGFTGSSIASSENNGNVIAKLRYAGGILGAIGSKATVTINGSTNKGTVTAGANGAGGITGGTIDTASTLTATSCTNEGTIKANNKVGGIVGCLWSSTSTLTECTNNGTVEAEVTENVYSGDIIGQNLDEYEAEQAA